jgi:hypothetical protein
MESCMLVNHKKSIPTPQEEGQILTIGIGTNRLMIRGKTEVWVISPPNAWRNAVARGASGPSSVEFTS